MLTNEQKSLIDNFKLDRKDWMNSWIIELYKNHIPIDEIILIVQNCLEYYSTDIMKIIVFHLQTELDIQGGK